MFVLHGNPEEVAGKKEAGDLPPAVRQQLGQPQQSGFQTVDLGGPVGLEHHGLADRKPDSWPAGLERSQRVQLQHPAHRKVAHRAIETWMALPEIWKGRCLVAIVSRSSFKPADVRQINDPPPSRCDRRIHGIADIV